MVYTGAWSGGQRCIERCMEGCMEGCRGVHRGYYLATIDLLGDNRELEV